MRKSIIALLCIAPSLIVSSALAESLSPGEYVVGEDISSGWYSVSFGENTVSPVHLADGCIVTLTDDIASWMRAG